MVTASRRALGISLLGSITFTGWLFIACVGDDPGAEPTVPAEGGTGTGLKDLGVPCGNGSECNSTICVDGVCCDKACDGTCEACNVAGNVGRCAAVPAGQDPDKECKGTPPEVPDAGAFDPDAAPPDGGTSANNLPDGGISGDDKLCAGACDGNRACAYPDTTKTCGTTYCSDSAHRKRVSCDGRGNCGAIVTDTCKDFSCEQKEGSADCRASCASPADCQSTHYCNGATNKCEKKKAVAIQCLLATECETGFCNGSAADTSKPTVCCDTKCEGVGSSCIDQGKVGTCTCSACATGPCKLYYRDADGDGFGDKNGTIENGNAQYGCAAGPAPGTGVKPDKWVLDNTDCYDVNDANGANVKPGQTQFFDVGYGPGNANFDYDCNGQISKLHYDSPSLCRWCTGGDAACGGGGGGGGGVGCAQTDKCPSTTALPGHRCGPDPNSPFAQCKVQDQIAFEQIVPCGGTADLKWCALESRCTVVNGPPGPSIVYRANEKQRCR